ncbi:hypothetical protein Dxin01_01608 [Deinococcus xinjiangensis]|uniref:Uncharacterized protein n=1 Tax=Deinococcus xinjiangensis TaxID=457454 RepID=A0ABP9V9C9_9DEIO
MLIPSMPLGWRFPEFNFVAFGVNDPAKFALFGDLGLV